MERADQSDDIHRRAREEFEKRLAEVTPEDRERLFVRTRKLGYEARRRALMRRPGEPRAIIMDPVESPLWLVSDGQPSHLDELMSTPDGRQELLETARRVIDMTNEVVDRYNIGLGKTAASAQIEISEVE